MINSRYSGIVNNVDDFVYHILGCGAIGSSTAVQLARMGANEIILYDFDKVEDVNVGVSQYTMKDIGKYKTEALQSHLKLINPNISTITMNGYFEEWNASDRNDIVILGFDSMSSRMDAITRIANAGKADMPYALIDGRMGAEHYQQYTFLRPTLNRYAQTWYTDESGDPEPCNAKATSYCSNMSGSFIVNAIRKIITHQPFDKEISFNFPTMMLELK
tara:strand:- start:49 stop:702 length:654 start_codon:yes stop_codon:yes gene_type:complete